MALNVYINAERIHPSAKPGLWCFTSSSGAISNGSNFVFERDRTYS